MRYAIIGFGCAGYHCAKAIREQDATGEIVVYSDTGLAPYNPMLTTYYVAGRLDYEGMFPFGSLGKIAADLNLVFAGKPATVLCAQKRTIRDISGEEQAYDRLLLSTGASNIVPPVPGLPAERLFTMRTLEDAGRLRQGISVLAPRRALVVGASMVGIKVVELLHNAGVETTLIDLSGHIFSLAAYPETAAAIEGRLADQGIGLRFSTSLAQAVENEDGLLCTLSDGNQLESDMVVMCIGTRANTALAVGQLEIGRGILVDSHMQSSVEGIYAAGDCAEGRNLQTGDPMIIGLWANAGYQGRNAGRNMAGGTGDFGGNIIHNITHFMDMDFIAFGDNRVKGEALVYGTPDKGLYIRAVLGPDGRIAGMNLLGNYRISGILKNYMLRVFRGESGQIPAFQQARLVREGVDPKFIQRLEGCVK